MKEPLKDDVAALLRERFGIEESKPVGVEVPAARVLELASALKELGFHYFVYCAAAHHPAKDELPDRVLVEYRVRRLPAEDLAFRVWVPTGETTPSLAAVWRGADWQEREQWDLVGVPFAGHPDLRRLMLPDDGEGHPLRKDHAADAPRPPWR